jgi:uncharacterized protein (TIGR02466 family)
MISIEVFNWGPCLAKMNLEDDQINKIENLCSKNKDYDFRKSLAGHLNHEYQIDNLKLEEIIESNLNAYKFALEQHVGLEDKRKLHVKSAWVNYMQHGDFNPLHTHDECDFSGVLYLSVPNEIEKEYKNSISNGSAPGEIKFILGTPMKNYITSQNFFPNKGMIFIFPDNLLHMVSPFKSHVERISVAFNLKWRENI